MAADRQRAERLADEELMPLIGAKDPEAFAVLFDRHGGAAYSLAYRIVGERGAAEDVTQEAFISLWRSGARYDRTRGSVRSWMLSIVRNRAIDALRAGAGKAPKLDFDDEAVLEQRPAPERTDEQALQRETAGELRGALGGGQCVGEVVELTGEHLVERVQGEPDAVVGDPVLLEVVGADLVGATAALHLVAASRRQLRLLALTLRLEHPGAQDPQRLVLVLELALLVLARDDETGG